MAQTITVDGTNRHAVIARTTAEWSESAYLGEVGNGRFRLDDDSGNISAVGWKTIVTDQSSCTAWPRLYTGFVGKKSLSRGEQYTSGASREISVETVDSNDLLQRLRITGTDGNRPREEIDERLAWLLGSDYVYSFSDLGNVASSSLVMTKTDYRGQYPGDVIAACAKRAAFNYYVRYNDDEDDWELVFRDDNTSTDDTSDISITTDGTANSTSSFAFAQDWTLDIDPEHVYSGASAGYSKATVYETLPSTAAAFVARDGATDDSGINTSDQARKEARQFLAESAAEEYMLRGTLRMRAAYVNLIRPGQRVPVTIPALAQEGYHAGAFWRVLRRTVTQPLNTDNDYDVALDLSPQETIVAANPCDTEGPTPSGTYWPLGGSGVIPNPSDGVLLYWRAGYEIPGISEITGRTDHGWHFPVYGAGGPGTIDYAGDCTSNRLYMRVVGNGTIAVQTEIYGAPRDLYMSVDGTPVTSGPSGSVLTWEIDDVTLGDCVRIVHIGDVGTACGQKWGFSQMDWTAA